MAVVYRCVGSLTVNVFFRSPSVFHSQDSFSSTFHPRLWETSSGVVVVGVFAAEARKPLLLCVFVIISSVSVIIIICKFNTNNYG